MKMKYKLSNGAGIFCATNNRQEAVRKWRYMMPQPDLYWPDEDWATLAIFCTRCETYHSENIRLEDADYPMPDDLCPI